MLLRARVVLPITAPPIENGAVLITGNRIARVGRWSELRTERHDAVVDCGDAILLPGLVNAHCHLDYSDMAGKIPAPGHFADWIKAIMALKAQWGYSEYASSWLHGARMLTRTGTTTVGDIEAAPELLVDVWPATALRLYSFIELTCVRSRAAPEKLVHEAGQWMKQLPCLPRKAAGISPHALYSTTPELLRCCVDEARGKGWRITMHVAESREEMEMYQHAKGHLHGWLKRQRDMSDCGATSPVRQLHKLGVLDSQFLAVHVNYLGPGDAALLGRSGASVVHCPRSHDYFKHDPFPLAELTAAGVNICLGTDSLASVAKKRGEAPELDLFAEMRALARRFPNLGPEPILRMATVNGAKALGWPGQVGELAGNAHADMIAIPFSGRATAAGESVVHHAGAVTASMIGGEWAMAPGAGRELS